MVRNRSYSTLPLIAVALALLVLQPAVDLARNGFPAKGSLPLSFEPNAGQTDEAVRFKVRSLGGTLFFTAGEVALALPAGGASPPPGPLPVSQGEEEEARSPAQQAVLRMRFEGANPAPEITAGELLPGVVNYFLGDDPVQWRTNVPTYAGVNYQELYPGIDLAYDGMEGLLKGTYTVAAGADPSVIRWRYLSAEGLEVDAASGDLRVTLPGGNVLTEQRPAAWQEIGGVRVPVEARFTLADDSGVGFGVGTYDSGYALTIDPVLVYSTYLGGGGYDSGKDVAVDTSGNIYVYGATPSSNFPGNSALQTSMSGPGDVFITKISPDGSSLLYSTYLGGAAAEEAGGIAVDAAGNVFISGSTTSTDFPTANPLQSSNGGSYDTFVASLNADGASLAYSTYMGGSSFDVAAEIAMDLSGNVYLTGRTQSANFPTQNALQSTHGGGTDDAFVAKITSGGSALTFSTFLGGSGDDSGVGVAANSQGNTYVTGATSSSNFPIANALQLTGSVFVTKINATGSAYIYSTHFGGGSADAGLGIATDTAGNAYVVGNTNSSSFPTVNPVQATRAGDSDAFLTKFNPGGSALIYSTYLGGTGGDAAKGVAVDPWGNVYLVGETYSTDFPVTSAVQPAYGGNPQDSFITKVNAEGSTLLYSTYLGGASFEEGWGIAIDAAGSVYVTGMTLSTNFPTMNPFQASNAGDRDVFVAQIRDGFVVNSTDDITDGTCDTTHCSLREAINAANAAPGTDTIAFDIPGAGPHSIQPATVLPTIIDPVIIDGTTEPDYAGTPVIEIDGSLLSAVPFTSGLTITSGNSTIRGLVINRFTFGGILLGTNGGSVIEGNYLGTDITGTAAQGNRDGIYILGSANNRIGGTTATARNIISGNTDDGVNLEGALSTGNLIQGNYIGTTANGVDALGNAGDGIKISETSSNNTIGGTNPGEGNVIAFNNRNGVYGEEITSGATGNAILGNSIHSNTRLGIDLRDDLVTANDPGDADTGPNNLQNFPVIDSAGITANSVVITGSLDSVAQTTYTVEFFVNAACDASGNGEGRVFIGATTVTTDGSGHAAISATLVASVPAGSFITATATDPNNNTSEFSQCRQVLPPEPSADLSVTQSDSPEAVAFGGMVTYTIVATNNGPDALTTTTLTDDLPESNFVSASPQESCSQTAGIVTCNLGGLASGASATVIVVIQGGLGPSLVNVVSVSGNLNDPNPGNNSDTETTTVIATSTPTYTPSKTHTPTFTYTPSNTPTPLTLTPTASSTPLPAPPAFIPGPTPTPSDTPVPPSTLTPSPIPTATNVPFLEASPTATHTPLPPPPPMG